MALETGGSISIAPRRMTTSAAADLARPEARRVSHRNDVRLSQFVGQKAPSFPLDCHDIFEYVGRYRPSILR
jgi:hypothetical protein